MIQTSEISRIQNGRGRAFVGFSTDGLAIITVAPTKHIEYTVAALELSGSGKDKRVVVADPKSYAHVGEVQDYLNERLENKQVIKMDCDYAVTLNDTAAHFADDFQTIWNATR